MKFFEKLMIDEYNANYEKPDFSLWGGDVGPSDERMLYRTILPKIKKAKSKKDLDDIYNKILKTKDKGHIYNNSLISLLKQWFNEKLKELNIKESFDFDMILTENKNVEKYIKRIKNIKKKLFAQKYYKWKKGGEKGDSPESEGLGAMARQAVRMEIDDLMKSTLTEAPINKSRGWTQQSIEKFEKTIGIEADKEGFFDVCVKRMSGKEGFDDKKAKGFCAAIKDAKYNSPNWRGKGKTEKQAKTDTKENQYSNKKKLKKK